MRTESFTMVDPDSKKTAAIVAAMIGSVVSSFESSNRYRDHPTVVGERISFREPTARERDEAMYAEARDEDRAIAEIGLEDFLRSLEGEASS